MKHKLLNKLLTLTLLILGGALFSPAWGDDVTYTFTSKSWGATAGGYSANWTKGADGNGFTSGQGLQVTTTTSGANGTSPITFTEISQIVITYNTNKSAGKGSIGIKIGENDETSNNVAYSGSVDGRSANFTTTFNYATPQTGNVKITVNTTTNSIYVKSVKITYSPTHTLTYSATNGSIGGVVYGTSTPVESGASVAEGGKVTLTATPSDGYEFSSWEVSGTGSTLSSTSTNPTTFTMGTANATVTANFTATGGTTTYSVTYNANDATSGNVPTDNNEYEEGDEVTVLGNTGGLAKTGYDFGGWNTQANGEGTTYAASETFNITGNTTLYAKWTPYTITAQSNNNSYGTVSLQGYVITANPETGYRYASPAYTIDPANSASVVQNGDEFTITPSANTTVTINFEAIPTHTATFSVNGNTTAQDFVEGASIIFPSDPADISEKKFVGWTSSSISGTTDDAPSFVTSATMSTSDVTFYAVFADVTPGIETSTTKTITTSTENIPTGYGTANTFSEYTLEGIKFMIQQMYLNSNKLQWRASGNSNGTGTMYNKDALNKIQSVVLTYNGDNYKNFTLNIGDSENPTSGTSITPSESQDNENVYTYDCSSYNKSYFVLANGTYAGYLSSIAITYLASTPATYANYCTSVVITYSVTYNANDATSGDVPTDNNEYEEGDEVTVLGNTGSLAKTGFAFGGWNTKSDGSGDNYYEDNTFEITANTTLYAKWVPYEITAVSNNESYGTVSREGLVITGSPKSGYRYASPAYSVTSGSATVAQEGNEFTVTPASDCTVQINFEEIPTHTVTVTGTGGTITVKDGDDTIDSGSSVREETVLTIIAEAGVGKIFKEWKLTGATPVDKDAATTTFTMGTENVTIEAVYDDAVTHAITYSVNGITTTVNVIEGEDVDLSAPTSGVPTGYAFKGWRTSTLAVTDTDPDDYITSATSTADITYYAVLAIETKNPTTTHLTGDEIASVFAASGMAYADAEKSYSDTSEDMTWGARCTTNTGRHWIQLRNDNDTYIKAVAPQNITGVKVQISNASNESGGIDDISKHGAFSAKVNLDKVQNTNSGACGSAASSAINNNYLTISADGTSNIIYIHVTGAARVWSVDVTYNATTFSGYCTTIPPVAVTVTASSYATFASDFPLDFTDKEIKAYIAKAKDDGTGVTFDRVYKIPAGTGVLLYKDGGAEEAIPVTTESTDDVTNNVFVRGEGVAVASVVGNMYNYILNIVDNVVGFYKAAGNKVAKNRAYIQVESASLAKDFFSMPGFDDSTTGVNEVNGSGLMVNGPVYDLQGRRVEKPGKGLYIVNGKKVLKY